MDHWINKTHVGDCRKLLAKMGADGVRVQTCVTSPPYFGLRDYGCEGQIGLEASPSEYIDSLVQVFKLIRGLLTDDGTLWLNLGDSYNAGREGGHPGGSTQWKSGQRKYPLRSGANIRDLKPKDLVGIPWRVALALQADGWYLRSDIIEEVEVYCPCCGWAIEEHIWRWAPDRDLVWKKPNPMPESVHDRPTRSHEYLFLLSKSPRYYYDAKSIAEAAVARVPGEMDGGAQRARDGSPANAPRNYRKQDQHGRRHVGFNERYFDQPAPFTRNRRSVWTIATTPFRGAHFATFPRALVEPCILAGSRVGDVVLDPFMGAGTTAAIASQLGRRSIGCEIQRRYLSLHELRRDTLRLSG